MWNNGSMQHALSLPPVGSPRDLADLAVTAEAGGWDAVFLWDHLHLVRSMRLPIVDPWVTLGAIAARTERVMLGPLITPLPRRRPWKVAKELVTLDHLSGGRAIFGAGLGFPPDDEFGAFGEPTDARARADLLDEGLVVLDALLRGLPFDHDGEHFHVHAELLPRSRREPRPPIWIAAMQPFRRPLARALRWDGIAPIGNDGGPLTPDALADYLRGVALPAGFDVVAGRLAGYSVADYEQAGATWLVESRWPDGDWFDELTLAAREGPRL
ncbi:MAG: class flavin-dependent oxidoreductase [Actinomycetia bacterium]|nr:class flavin-dependent oxidoreductase [Actinomycetes bacterium]